MSIDNSLERGAIARQTTPSVVRAALVMAGLAMLVTAVSFAFHAGWAQDLWPWPDKPLSYVFLGSVLAAIALPTIWIGATGELGAIEAGALDLAITYTCAFVYLLTILGEPGQPALGAYVAVFGVAAISTIAVVLTVWRTGMRDTRPMPLPVRVSFYVSAFLLFGAGVCLIAHVNVLPWDPRHESSIIFGFVFLGASVYFIHGLWRPSWANAAGQLAGFLAYDVILLVPLLRHANQVHGVQTVSTVVYSTVLVLSGLVGIYYLFVARETRLFGGLRSPTTASPSPTAR
ncbi:MAG TPA: hypothetical protein VGM91_12540 [Conexibacter sp.]|jgi:hypothetical protein